MYRPSETSGIEGRQTTSPVVRLSKLNKRRRPPKEGGSSSSNIDGQNRMSSSAAASSAASKRSRLHHNGGSGARKEGSFNIDVHCKENLLNGRPTFYARKADKGGSDSATVDGGKIDDVAAVQIQAGDAKTMTAAQSHSAVSDEKGKSCPTTSILGFMDDMDISAILPAIISLLGIDLDMYQSPAALKRYLERSFEYKKKHADTYIRPNSQPDDQNAVYHNILGRINPPSVDSSSTDCHRRDHDTNHPSIAFPQRKRSLHHETILRDEDSRFMLSQHANHQRGSCHGLCLSSSWYRFPSFVNNQQPQTMSENHFDDEGYSNMNEEDQRRVSASEIVNELDSNLNSSIGVCPAECRDSRQFAAETNAKQSIAPSITKVPTPPTTSPLKCQGKIRIESDRGATIREVYDIEKSAGVIGKLNIGDERFYLEKKILSPPPISLLDASDDECDSDYDDEECVAVVRYKICLHDADLDASQGRLVHGGNNIPLVGWISDRGRIANDPYLILREM